MKLKIIIACVYYILIVALATLGVFTFYRAGYAVSPIEGIVVIAFPVALAVVIGHYVIFEKEPPPDTKDHDHG